MWEHTTVRDLQVGDIFSRWGRIFAWNGSAGELLESTPSLAPAVIVGNAELWPVVRNLWTQVLPIRDQNMRVLRYVESAKEWTPPPPFRGEMVASLQPGRRIVVSSSRSRMSERASRVRLHSSSRSAVASSTSYLPGDRPWQEIPYSDPMLALAGHREPRSVVRRRNGQFVNPDNPLPDGDRYDPNSDPTNHYC